MALKIKNEADYQELLSKIAKKGELGAEPEISEAPAPKAKKTKKAATSADAQILDVITTDEPVKKRGGVKETPIVASLRACSIDVEAGPKHITLLFKGARLFTLNEIYAILQFRSYIIFSYKKQWHSLVQNALRLAGKNRPNFDGPCKVTLFRQGKKKVDRDSLMVMFKYIIDALKHDEKNGHVGIFPDDNPDIVYSDEKIQTIGEPMVGIRIDLIDPVPGPDGKNAASLFDAPPSDLLAHIEAAERSALLTPAQRRKAKKAAEIAALPLPAIAAASTQDAVGKQAKRATRKAKAAT